MIGNENEVTKYDFKSPKRLLDEEIPIIRKGLTHYIDLVEQSISDYNHFRLNITKGDFEFTKFENIRSKLIDFSSGWTGRLESNYAKYGCFWDQETFSSLLYIRLKGSLEGIENRILLRKNLITDFEISIIEDIIIKDFHKTLFYSFAAYGNKKPRLQNIETSLIEMEDNFESKELVVSIPIQFHWKDLDSNELITKACMIFNQQFLREYNWRTI
ncbi:hypothetical protein [Leptospira sp. GIMC2001]|uniref:hypothetical protein n=1 Tax=Leptospira sp. GIMC2001 TaxID=1513297 RepID=UPI002349E270|nr:hypothetical protein [Leptospira sp. GIMC2001]WCL50766.1 hypothetical protein O4O04_08120 [Leptospira sp. GIMC2001]